MIKNYLIIDLGTGNSRVGLMSSEGQRYGIKTFENVYYRDELYEDAQYFNPEEWWKTICACCKELILEYPQVNVAAVITSAARQSIVLYDKAGQPFLGLPNIDNRGRKWVNEIPDAKYIYERTGRWVTEDFPAAKLLGLQKGRPGLYKQISKMNSLSEWIGEMFTGKMAMEPSQACETQLFDIETLEWSERICDSYGIRKEILPPIQMAGTSLGRIKDTLCEKLKLSPGAEFIIGGADTQVAVKGTGIAVGDIGIVSGTTSPVVSIVDYKYYDEQERCWTDCNLGGESYQVETNPGVTGLNYQRFKNMLFQDRSYEALEQELEEKDRFFCTASFSSLNFSKKQALKKGGFMMSAPLDSNCDATDLLWAVLADIACSIYVQYQNICEMIPHNKNYILGCGGGFQSRVLCQMIADLTGKELILYEGFEQASLYGCIEICNEYFGINSVRKQKNGQVFVPSSGLIQEYNLVWERNRQTLNPVHQCNMKPLKEN